MNSNWSYSLETVKLGYDLCDLELWPLTLTYCMDLTLVISNNSRKFHDDMMMGTKSKRCDRQTDGQTENTICRAAWSQLKTSTCKMKFLKNRTDLSTFKIFIFEKYSCFVALVVFLVIVQSSELIFVCTDANFLRWICHAYIITITALRESCCQFQGVICNNITILAGWLVTRAT